MAFRSGRRDRFQQDPDESPVFSRLFVIGDKRASEDDFRDAFKAFGTVQYVKSVKDKHTGESKGIVYIKMSKTSEAAAAVEEMHGKCLPAHPRPLKVLVAGNRGSGEQLTDDDIMERMMRLFIVIPRSFTESDVSNHFEKFGPIDSILIVRDKESGESKGLAFVRFHRASHAALAFENCDSEFRPKFADPVSAKPSKRDADAYAWDHPHRDSGSRYEQDRHYHSESSRTRSRRSENEAAASELVPFSNQGPFSDIMTGQQAPGLTRLTADVSPLASQAQLTKLFGIVPGLEYCDLHQNPSQQYSTIFVKYTNPQCCAYAKESISGLEYPPGHPLILSYYQPDSGGMASAATAMSTGGLSAIERNLSAAAASMQTLLSASSVDGGSTSHNMLSTLMQNLQQATMMLRARAGTSEQVESIVDDAVTRNLPPPQPMFDGPMKKRLFIVASPTRIPLHVLKDLFCRFGFLISVDYMAGKNCGFAKYGSEESADTAKAALHGIEMPKFRLKVLDAEDPPEDGYHKRPRMS